MQALLTALVPLLGTILTGAIAYFALRNKTDQEIKVKRNEDNSEITREYIKALQDELARCRAENDRKEATIQKANDLLNQASRELQDMTIRFTKLEVLYENAVDDLKHAMEELNQFRQKTTDRIDVVQKEIASHKIPNTPPQDHVPGV